MRQWVSARASGRGGSRPHPREPRGPDVFPAGADSSPIGEPGATDSLRHGRHPIVLPACVGPRYSDHYVRAVTYVIPRRPPALQRGGRRLEGSVGGYLGVCITSVASCALRRHAGPRGIRSRSGDAPPPGDCPFHRAAGPRQWARGVPRTSSRVVSASRAVRSASLVHPHETGRPPAGAIASGTRREDGLLPRVVADEPPGLAPDVLVERMRVTDLCRNGAATARADGPERRVALGAVRAALSWHEAPDGAQPVAAGAPARTIGSPAVARRSGSGRERPSVV